MGFSFLQSRSGILTTEAKLNNQLIYLCPLNPRLLLALLVAVVVPLPLMALRSRYSKL